MDGLNTSRSRRLLRAGFLTPARDNPVDGDGELKKDAQQLAPVPRSDTSSVSEMLSASELEQLKRNGREQRAFAIQEFGLEE